MKKIKISHEVPFCLLEKSREFNDYDYCLPHLMDENEEYRNFFYKSKEMGRYIVMDNSFHELGEAYNTERLLIMDKRNSKPSEFIIPDVWEEKDASVRNARQWANIEFPEGVMKVAVVQAKSSHEAMLCTKIYKDLGYKKIAYSYGASYYNEVCPHPNQDLGKAIGRFTMISSLYEQRILSQFDRVHLLGTASPIEFGMYKNIECIESIDTSNPIMAAVGEIPYTKMGLHSKPLANMNKYQDMSIEFLNEDIVEYNVSMFREINGL
jgi:hypothetical protein